MSGSGNAAGSSLGAAISRWLGSGDYTVARNSIVRNPSGSVPMMHQDGQSIVVRHKEFLTEVLSNTSFTVNNSYPLNPGMQKTFPWMAAVACNFQEYKIRGMVFHYVPTSGFATGGTNTALGSVMLQTSYRSNDQAPASKIEVLNEYWSCESVPSEAFCHPVECDPKENPFNVQYVRSGPAPTGDSQLLYDLGMTYVCTSGQQAAGVVLGDLWVTYEIELKKPIMASNVTNLHFTDKALIAAPADGSTYLTGVTTHPYGNFQLSFSGTTITFPADVWGYFDVYVQLEATTTFSACVWPSSAPTFTGCTSVTVDAATSPYNRSTLGGSGGTLNRAGYRFAIFKDNKTSTCSVTLPVITTLTGTVLQTTVNAYVFDN